jgi:hypothetical protein
LPVAPRKEPLSGTGRLLRDDIKLAARRQIDLS